MFKPIQNKDRVYFLFILSVLLFSEKGLAPYGKKRDCSSEI